MSEFVASNGYRVELGNGAGSVRNRVGDERHVFGRYSIEALREYFDHVYERGAEDQRIKAWHRIAKHPFFDDAFQSDDTLIDAMVTKLDALMPKPWLAAKTGEVWVLTVEGEESVWMVNNATQFENPDSTYNIESRAIIDARRIWPEDES